MDRQRIPKKLIVGAALGVLGLFVLIFCLTNTIVVLDNVGEEKTISIVGEKGTEKEIRLGENQKGKRLLLPRDKYSIKVTSPHRYSFYSKNLNGMYKKISLKTSPQQKSKFAGKSDSGCLVGEPVVFSPCLGYKGSVNVSSGGIIKPLVIDELYDHNHEGEGPEKTDEKIPTSSAKDFGGDLLALLSKDNQLSIKRFNAKEQRVTGERLLAENYGSEIKDSFFDTYEDRFFAIFNPAEKSVNFYDGFDSSAKTIRLGDALEAYDDAHDVLLHLSEDKIYVVLTKNIDELDGHGSDAADDFEHKNTFDFSGKLIVVDKKNNFSISEHPLPKSLIPSLVDVDGTDRLIVGSQYTGDVPMYEFYEDKFKKIDLPPDVVSFCWAAGSLYFNNVDNQIFSYSFAEEGGFLVYESLWGEIIDLNCSGSRVSFGIVPEVSSTNEASETPRYFLTSDEHKGARIDGVLPFYLTFKADTYFVEQSSDGVLVRLEYDSVGDGPSSKEEVVAKVQEELKTKTRALEMPNVELSF